MSFLASLVSPLASSDAIGISILAVAGLLDNVPLTTVGHLDSVDLVAVAGLLDAVNCTLADGMIFIRYVPNVFIMERT